MVDSDGGDRDFAVVSRPYEITLGDYRAMIEAQPRGLLRGRYRHGFVFLAGMLNVGLSMWFVFGSHAPWYQAPWASYLNAVLGIGLILFSFAWSPFILRRHYRLIGYAGKPHSFEGARSMFKVARDGLQSQLTWDGLIAYSDTPDHFFFWINRAQAVILPKRALVNQSDSELIHQFLSSAQVKST